MRDIKFKHEIVMVDDLRLNAVTNIPVMMLEENNTFPLRRNKNGDRVLDPVTFPETFMLNYVTAAGGSGEERVVYIYYFNMATKKTEYKQVHHTVQLAHLTGKKGKEVMEEALKEQVKTLELVLGHGWSIGSDPEIFVEDDNGIIPAFNFLGSKADPKHTYNNGGRSNKIYWDGFQAEFETTPNGCLQRHSECIQQAMKELLYAAKAHNKKAKLSTKTVAHIKPTVLEEAKNEHVALGCAPSYNVYGMSGKFVSDPRTLPIRPAGGHIHFGIGMKTHEQVKDMVKALDAVIGVMCVSLFQNYDDPVRREYYGLAGEYRLPPHGLEYRTLSNAWLIHPFVCNIVIDTARKALVFGEKGFLKFWKADEAETIACINNCDVELAHKIMDRNKDIIIKLFKAAYQGFGATDKVYEALFLVFKKGMDCVVKKPQDFEGNWNFAEATLYTGKPFENFRYSLTKLEELGKKLAS